MNSFYKRIKLASFDVLYNIYDSYISKEIIIILFDLIVIMQTLSINLCDGVKFYLNIIK